MPHLILLISLLAAAGETPPATTTAAAAATAAPATAAGVEVSADLRDEYLFNQDIVISLTVKNNGTAPVTVADLSARPWRVRFLLTLPNGQSQARFTTPPATEPTTTWTLPPRSQRRVSLEIPSGGALNEGRWPLQIEVDLGDQKVSLPPAVIRVAPAQPVAAQLAPDPLLAGRLGLQTLWLHKAASGYDLYLTLADAKSPTRVVSNNYLDHLAAKSQPQLSAARPSDAGDRYVLWPEGEHAIRYARVQANGLRGETRLLSLPWPKVEIAGQGATDGSAGLHVPIWVPAPKGAAGELRLASADERGKPQLRKIVGLPARPPELITAVDASGAVQLLVRRGDLLDLYSLPNGYGADLPVPGKRIWAGKEGQHLLDARFGSLAASEGQAGGLAVLIAYSEAGRLQSQWLSLKGAALLTPSGTDWPTGSTLLSLLPASAGAPGLLVKTADGVTRYQEAEAQIPVALPERWGLVRDALGRPTLLSTVDGQGVRAALLEPRAPEPK